jgi:L-ascorbate metabolism protein UlaG (beta-lactamase superfamily)
MKLRKAVRFFMLLLALCAGIALAVWLFLTLNPVFGGSATAARQADYAARAVNYRNGRFFYPAEYVLPGLRENVYRSQKGTKPQAVLALEPLDIPGDPEPDKLYVTWLGHSALLLQMGGKNLLIDPVFSDRASPVAFTGPGRFTEKPDLSALPHLDLVLLTHDHYDHLDMETIRALDSKTDRFAVPLGVENHLIRWGVAPERITALAWWEELQLDGLTLGCTPARHYSSRKGTDAGSTLWCSWVLKTPHHLVLQTGDTGYGGHFAAIHEQYGDFDLVLTDGAQYDLKWHDIHMLPEEAVQACTTLGAKLAMPIHWGAYSLSPHPWDDAVERFTAAAEQAGLAVITPRLGQTADPDSPELYRETWWRALP